MMGAAPGGRWSPLGVHDIHWEKFHQHKLNQRNLESRQLFAIRPINKI